jgi:hypothetical protein
MEKLYPPLKTVTTAKLATNVNVIRTGPIAARKPVSAVKVIVIPARTAQNAAKENATALMIVKRLKLVLTKVTRFTPPL